MPVGVRQGGGTGRSLSWQGLHIRYGTMPGCSDWSARGEDPLAQQNEAEHGRGEVGE